MTPDDIRSLCDRVHDVCALAETPPSGNTQGGGGGDSAKPPVPIGFLDAKVSLHQVLASWALMVGEEGEFVIDCDDNAMSMAAWLFTKAEWLAGHPAADDFHAEVSEAVSALASFYKPRRDDRKYLGEHSGVPIYAKPAQELVELPDGTTHRVATVRGWQLAQSWDYVGTCTEVADIARVLFGYDIDARKLSTIASNDKMRDRRDGLKPVTEEPKTYRVSDVVTRLRTSRKGKTNVVA